MKQSILNDNIQAATYLSDAIASSFGPKGMNKLLVDNLGDSFITNDGATIIDKIEIQHPIARLVAGVGRTMDESVSDGAATGIILTGELLKQAGQLIEQGLHPNLIIKGFDLALKDCLKIIEQIKKPIKKGDVERIIKTTVRDELLTNLVIDATREVSTNDILLITKTGRKEDSIVYSGVGIDKEPVHPRMPRDLKGSKVLITKTPIEVRNTDNEAEINISSPLQLKSFIDNEHEILKRMVDLINESGANVVIAQKGIDERAQELLARNGIMAIRRVRERDIKTLIKATGARLVKDFDQITSNDLGFAGIVTIKKVGDEKITFLTACPGKARTIVIRGASTQSIIEHESLIKKGIGVTHTARLNNYYLPGAGRAWAHLNSELMKKKLSGKEQLSYESFAKAMSNIVKILVKNHGLNPYSTVIDLNKGLEKDVIVPSFLIEQALISSTEIANLILRIDSVLVAK